MDGERERLRKESSFRGEKKGKSVIEASASTAACIFGWLLYI